MPYDEVMPKFKRGELKSGGSGKTVTNPKQAVAIMMSEKKAAGEGKKEYQAHKHGGTVKPSTTEPFKHNVAETAVNPTGPMKLAKGGHVRKFAEGGSTEEPSEGSWGDLARSADSMANRKERMELNKGRARAEGEGAVEKALKGSQEHSGEGMKKGGVVKEKKAPWRRW